MKTKKNSEGLPITINNNTRINITHFKFFLGHTKIFITIKYAILQIAPQSLPLLGLKFPSYFVNM